MNPFSDWIHTPTKKKRSIVLMLKKSTRKDSRLDGRFSNRRITILLIQNNANWTNQSSATFGVGCIRVPRSGTRSEDESIIFPTSIKLQDIPFPKTGKRCQLFCAGEIDLASTEFSGSSGYTTGFLHDLKPRNMEQKSSTNLVKYHEILQ